MRRWIVVFTLLPLATLGLGIQPASAHVSFNIVGYQYTYLSDFTPGIAGWVSGPVRISDGPTTDGLESITNRDLLEHTFTQCVAACDTAAPTWGTLFDVRVPPGPAVDISGLPIQGTVVFGCRIHPLMRGEVTVFS